MIKFQYKRVILFLFILSIISLSSLIYCNVSHAETKQNFYEISFVDPWGSIRKYTIIRHRFYDYPGVSFTTIEGKEYFVRSDRILIQPSNQ